MDTLAIKRWLQRRQKHYKLATDDYLVRLREALKRSNKLENSSLDKKSIIVVITQESPYEELSLDGIAVKRDDLPEAKVSERVRLLASETNQKLATAFVLSISPSKVKIKFDKPLVFPKKAKKKEETKGEEEIIEAAQVTGDANNDSTDERGEDKQEGADELILSNEKNPIAEQVSHQGEEGQQQQNEVDQTISKSLELIEEDDPPSPVLHHVVVKFEFDYLFRRDERIRDALLRVKNISLSLPIHKCLLGNYKDWLNEKYNLNRVVPIYGLIPAKWEQLRAIEQSMRKRISLVESVAGGGKTLVAAHLACLVSNLRQRRVLICSPIQATVDKLAEMIYEAGMNVIQLPHFDEHLSCEKRRAAAKSRGYKWQDYPWSLDSHIDREIFENALILAARENANRLYVSNSETIELARRISRGSSNWRRQRMERQLLSQADIVCCTEIQAGSCLLDGLKFDMLIIDDVQFASEIDCLIPMSIKGIKQITLLGNVREEILLARSSLRSTTSESGDKSSSLAISKTNSINTSLSNHQHRGALEQQDSPIQTVGKPNGLVVASSLVVMKKKKLLGNQPTTKKSDIDLDQAYQPGGLFKRLLSMGLSPVILKHQYRMQETLAVFPNHQFYRSMLNDSTTNAKLLSKIREKYLKNSSSSLESPDETKEGGEQKFTWLPNSTYMTALIDKNSIKESLLELIDKLIEKEKVRQSKVAIITNVHYNLIGPSEVRLEVGTVADFIGREKDFIILLGANSYKKPSADPDLINNWDYLKNDLALEVALTRARLGLFIVTDLKGPIEENCKTIEQETTKSSGNTSYESQLTDCCKSWQTLVEFYRSNKLVI